MVITVRKQFAAACMGKEYLTYINLKGDYRMLDILKESKEMLDYAIKVRRHLHVNAEPTAHEFETVKYIMSELDAMGIPYENVPDGGVLGYIQGPREGKTVLLRADCDALGMKESPNNAKGPKVCVSKNDNAAHMCGHDSHVAMLLSAAKILSDNKKQLQGRVILLFERGEEGGNCIYYVMKHIQEKGIKIDSCWGNHIAANLPVGIVCIQGGPVNAGNVNFEVVLTGKGGHGSHPDKSNNPVDCFVAIMNGIKDIRMKYIHPASPLTYTIGMVQSGTKRNVIPETLTFAGTCRFHSAESGRLFKQKLKQVIELNSELYECKVEFKNFTGPSIPTVNNDKCAQIGIEAVEKVLGSASIVRQETSMGSESFSTLAAFYPSIMANVGAGNEEKGMTIGAHNPGFDIDESGMPYGIILYVAYAIAFLKQDDKIPFTPFNGDEDDLLAFMDRPVPPRFDC